MRTQGDEVHVDVDAVRAGSTPNVTRWVLAFGLIGAIALLTAIWVIGALSSDQGTHIADTRSRTASSGATR
jgi:hypothetical protein